MDLVGEIDWYVACLHDRIARKPVRCMDEAKAGYQRASARLAEVAHRLDELASDEEGRAA
jgi:hypothetical protein